jgi:hypothetical protein
MPAVRQYPLRKKTGDRPDISLVDFTRTIAIQDLHIAEGFADDEHVEQVGLGWRQRAPLPVYVSVGSVCTEGSGPLQELTRQRILHRIRRDASHE